MVNNIAARRETLGSKPQLAGQIVMDYIVGKFHSEIPTSTIRFVGENEYYHFV
jgi:hypothetical protein